MHWLWLASVLLAVASRPCLAQSQRPVETIAGSGSKSCSVLDYGAQGNNHTEDTAAVQRAINDTSCNEVVLPAPGVYLVRSLFLRSNLVFTIAANATLIAWPDIRTWNNNSMCVLCLTSGSEATSNLVVRGPGIIDGQGWRWWPYMKTIPRPFLLDFNDIGNTTITNLTLRNSPSWNTNLRGEDFSVTFLRIESNLDQCAGYTAAPNTDGINIGGRNIYVADCWIHNGDDCIPTNSFYTHRLGHLPTKNVLVERVHCECGTNGGVPIVEQDNSTVSDVVYRNMTVYNTNDGIGFKIAEPYMNVSSYISNITWENIEVKGQRMSGMYIDVYVEDPGDCPPPTSPKPAGWLTAHNLTYRNIFGSDLPLAGCFTCSASNPCTGLRLENVTLQSQGPFKCYNAEVILDGVSPTFACDKT